MKMEDETNKPILKVGDKVRIKSKEWFDSQYKSNREDIEPPEEYNRPIFDFMEQYCGNICTIKNVYINTIKFNENDEDWESWMFDLVEEEKKEEPQYKAGDKIVINSRDWYNASKDGFGSVIIEGSTAPFIEGMEKYCGKVCTIKESFKRDKGIYYYLEGIGYVWQSWMFSSAKESTKEESKKRRPFFRRDPQTGDTIKSPYFNGIIIGENNDKDAFLILTTPYFYKQWLYKDFITEIDGYGRYLYLIDTNECDLDIRANKLKESLLPENGIQVGDVIKSENKEEYIIISNPKYGNSYGGLNTRNYKYARIPRTNNIVLIEPGKYKDLIDTNISYLHERAQLLKDKLLKLNNLNISNNTSYNNSNEFDLSKVIYRSRRIK